VNDSNDAVRSSPHPTALDLADGSHSASGNWGKAI